jgi:type II secretory pathway pseudopilin PulG
MSRCVIARGYSVLELLFVTALIVTLSGVALPQTVASLDDFRAAGATRYVSSRLYRARMLAVMRSASVAIRFSRTPAGYSFTEYQDGNRNGVLTGDIKSGVDRRLGLPESLRDNFKDVEFGALPGLPAIDPGGTAPAASSPSPPAAHRPQGLSTSVGARRSMRCAFSAIPERAGC